MRILGSARGEQLKNSCAELRLPSWGRTNKSTNHSKMLPLKNVLKVRALINLEISLQKINYLHLF